MGLLSQASKPIWACRVVQYFFGKHYPFPYQLPYEFVYDKGILHVRCVPMKYSVLNFIPPLISFVGVAMCAAGIYILHIQSDNILENVGFWIWVSLIIVHALSIYGYLLLILDPNQICFKLWEYLVFCERHARHGKDNGCRILFKISAGKRGCISAIFCLFASLFFHTLLFPFLLAYLIVPKFTGNLPLYSKTIKSKTKIQTC